ncbi:MAG: hypothetical protein ACTS5I_11395, partial [Rhodanobacter sp.]
QLMAASAAAYMEIRWRPKGSDEAWSAPQRTTSGLHEVVVAELDLARNSEYEFEARNVSDCGASSVWVASDYTVPSVPPLPPVRPPTGSGHADGVQLDWSDGTSTRADLQYEIHRAPATGSYISTPPPEADASWLRVAVVSGTTWLDAVTDTAAYWYRIRTIDYRGATGAWALLSSPFAATISTPELAAAVDANFLEIIADVVAVQGQADTLRNDVDAAVAQVEVLQGQLGDIMQADVWDVAKTYPLGDLVQSGGKLYRSLIADNIGHAPAGATDGRADQPRGVGVVLGVHRQLRKPRRSRRGRCG